MKTLDEYYKMILISMVLVFFLPLTTLTAEDYWDWYTYATADESPYIYESSQWVTKYVYVDRNYFSDGFDEDYGTGFNMVSEWDIDVIARVKNTPEEAYWNYFELEGEAYHYCEEDWEWTGPPASAPSATIDFDLYAYGNLSTDGDIVVTAGTPSIGATGDIFCSAYSWPHDSQSYGYLEVEVGVSGSVSDSSNSHYRYYDCTPEQDDPDNGNNHSDEDDFLVSYFYWFFYDSDQYVVGSGIGTFAANGGHYAKAEASVGLIAYEGDTGDTWVVDGAYIYAESSFDMTSN